MNLASLLGLAFAVISLVVIVCLICTTLRRDNKRARSSDEREGYIRGYKQGRDGGAPEDW